MKIHSNPLAFYTLPEDRRDALTEHISHFYKSNKSKARLKPGERYAYLTLPLEHSPLQHFPSQQQKSSSPIVAAMQVSTMSSQLLLFRALLVAQSHQQQGIGRHCLTALQTTSQASLLCICHTSALVFYRKLGFFTLASHSAKSREGFTLPLQTKQRLTAFGCSQSQCHSLERLMQRSSKKETGYLMLWEFANRPSTTTEAWGERAIKEGNNERYKKREQKSE
ncbi:MAG: GNAT family N-acetyltransferase [Pontibacterium sp.]